jgi:hypothetical protein
VQLADTVAVVGVLGFGELGFEAPQRRVAVDGVLERGAVERRGLLRDVRDPPLLREIDLALVGVQLVAQQGEEARLARAVRPDQADAVAGIERDVGAFEQHLDAASEGDLGEADHGKARIVRAPGFVL